MNNQITYSVVDIETTGTDMSTDNRIIQFSCSIVKDGIIVETYSTDINPERDIPNRITQLTGIDAERVKNAPTFEQIAGKLYQLLNNTIFVAHNVNFDFPFLNTEFERIGYPEMENEAIDTVTLSQILLPTLSSYRLQDLSSYFNITHDQPHSADSDALATAKLLIVLLNQLHQLPSITLNQIIQLNPELPKETITLFRDEQVIREEQDDYLAIPKYLKLVHGLILRKRESPLIYQTEITRTTKDKFPKTTVAKTKLLKNLEVRTEQNKMMNLIYKNYANQKDHQSENLVIEAPTGIGKTLGYLLPFSYLVSQDKPLYISTSTTFLQEQLKNQGISLLNQVLPFDIRAVILKGNNHYLDLEKFKEQLTVYDNSVQTKFIKSQILVWLTLTQTGDLDELHLNIEQTPFINDISHNGIRNLVPHGEFYEEDFLRFNLAQAKKADMVIINHDYLLTNWSKFKINDDNKPYLLVDEAQQFSDRANRVNQNHLRPFTGISTINKLIAMWNTPHGPAIKNLLAGNLIMMRNGISLVNQLETIKRQLEILSTNTYNHFIAKRKLHRRKDVFEWLIPEHNFKKFVSSQKDIVEIIKRATNQFNKQINDIYAHTLDLENTLSAAEIVQLDSFNQKCQSLLTFLEQLLSALDIDDELVQSRVYWISVNAAKDILTMTFSYGMAPDVNFLADNVYTLFEPITFTGATLLPSKKSNYTFENLQLDRENTKIRRMKSDLSNADNAKIFLINDYKGNPNDEQYARYLANSIMRIFGDSKRQTLVLFNSLEMIKQVFQIIHETGFTANNLVLAQGINGSATKLSRQFIHSEPAILLGANTFWQGVDFPGHLLDNLVIAQLPFESPDDPYNHAKYSFTKSEGHNPFYSITLPRATLKLRQGIGRLLRTSSDFGTIFILDPRLITKHYGETILANLRTDIPVNAVSLTQAIIEMNQFYSNRHDLS